MQFKDHKKHPWRSVTFSKVAGFDSNWIRTYNNLVRKRKMNHLTKLVALACKFTKNNTPPWVFFTFLKLYKRYQVAQSKTNEMQHWTETGY